MTTIREATHDDIEDLARIIRESFRDVAERFQLTSENAPKHPSNCTTAWIQAAFEKGITYYIAEDDARACGCVALECANAEVCYLERLAVLPAFRRRGFGKALVNHVLAEAKKLKTRRIEIGIIAAHTELKQWYEKLGFVVKNSVRFEHLPFEVTFMCIELE